MGAAILRVEVGTDLETLSQLAGLKEQLSGLSFVGLVTSYADLVEPGAETDDAVRESLGEIFDSPRGIYAGGLISQDYQKANVQVSMKRGDNKSMQRVLDEADAFLAASPLDITLVDPSLHLGEQRKRRSGYARTPSSILNPNSRPNW